MTRSDLEAAVYRRLQKNTASVDSATQTRIRHFLNQRHRRILALPGMSHLRDTTTTVPSVANQSNYTVANVYAIKRIFEATNDRELAQLSMDEYRQVAPDPSAAPGTPTHYVLGNFTDGTWTFYLHPQPSAVITYTLDITSIVADFSGDSSEPLIPEEFHFLLELGASMDELVKTDDPRYQVWAEEYEEGIKALYYWIAIQTMSRGGPREFSALGAWYPHGS